MNPVLFTLENSYPLFQALCRELKAEPGVLHRRHFPDGESYLRIENPVEGKSAVVLANLSHPDEKFLPLCFLTQTLYEMGAKSVGLIAPYLCYMRQDRRFQPGEAVTSRIFSRLLSLQIDWLVTVDPHLHRYQNLNEIYSIPTIVLNGAPLLAQWIKAHLNQAFLVGPDSESEQWVKKIARQCNLPYVIGEKQRRGDRDVTVTLPDLDAVQTRPAIIIDDVISSGQTLLQCVHALKEKGITNIHCVAVHGVFADKSDQLLKAAGVDQLVTTDSIPHSSNAISLAAPLASAVISILTGE